MIDLPPELAIFSAFIDAQSAPVREAFQYCLCLMMVETGKMELQKTIPGDVSPLCVFKTSQGDTISVAKPSISQEDEAEIITVLREILRDEGLL